jgi:hypothetical protein
LVRVLFFKLEEEVMPALLLHLPKFFGKDCFFRSGYGMRCCLVVAVAQGPVAETAIF